MSNTIIECGMLSVRSSKAEERRQSAGLNGLSVNNACYSISGLESDTLSILNNKYPLTEDESGEILSTSCDCPAVFFDQSHYTFSIKLPDDTAGAYIFSISSLWCESADYDPGTQRLLLPVNFGNDLGDFEICWEWVNRNGERSRASFSAQVYSCKLDIYKHFRVMFGDVEKHFNWLSLDLLRQTAWGWHYSSESEVNLKTWLLIFQQVRSGMEERLERMITRHRRRLVDVCHYRRADKLRKIPSKLEEKVKEGLRENPGRHYSDKCKILDSDTPENRYIKHIFMHTLMQLNELTDKIEPLENVSDIFKERLKEWSREWTVLSRHHFWRGIGTYKGLRRQSQILIQDPLYAGIRRSWFLLQQGLEFLENDLKGGIQNAAQLYEIWCLAKIIEIIDNAGWKNISGKMDNPLYQENNSDIDNIEKSIGSVRFDFRKEYYSGAELSVLFQPTAGKIPADGRIWEGMTSEPVVQNPDIVLRLHRNDLPGRPVYTWIFDAKYRIENNLAPDDALNQMHRYRDAILWTEGHDESSRVIRESIGAFVLYPGDENTLTENSRQLASVKKTNIGAYPLKPEPDETGTKSEMPRLLSQKLNDLLTIDNDYSQVQEKTAEYFLSVPAVKENRKEFFAKCITRAHHDNMNTHEYWQNCRLYRLPVKEAEKQNLTPESWSYLIPASPEGEELGNFPILSVKKMKRSDIEKIYIEQNIPIYSKEKSSEDEYWLFELGDQLSEMPELDDIKNGSLVNVEEM